MTLNQAQAVAAMFREIGGFTKVEVEHRGSLDYVQGDPALSPEWMVRLWSINARAGNRNLTIVRDPISATDDAPPPPKDLKEAKLIAKKAKGKATARDQKALGRMAAERAVNRE